MSIGVSPAARNTRGETALLHAIRSANSRVAIHLTHTYGAIFGDHRQECYTAVMTDDWAVLEELLNLDGGRGISSPNERVDVNSLLMSLFSIPRFQSLISNHYDRWVDGEGIDFFRTNRLDGTGVLIRHGGDIRYSDDRQRTLLMAAIKAGNGDLARWLLVTLTYEAIELESREDDVGILSVSARSVSEYINAIDAEGENAISEAIRKGDTTMVTQLLRLNVALEWRLDGETVSALQVACQSLRYHKSLAIVDQLLEQNPSAFAIEDERGNTLLHYLAFGTDGLDTISAMETVISSQSAEHLNKQNKEGQTPLHFAVFGGVVSNVKFLLAHGARIDIADVRGYTLLHLATDDYGGDNHTILSELLQNIEPGSTVLDMQDQWGRTALMHAAGKHQPGAEISGNDAGKAMELLLTRGASVKARDHYGQTALHHLYGQEAEIEVEMQGSEGANPAFAHLLGIDRFGNIFESIAKCQDHGGKIPREFYLAKVAFLRNDETPVLSGKARIWGRIKVLGGIFGCIWAAGGAVFFFVSILLEPGCTCRAMLS